jgi:hypothetical protein
LRLCLSVIFCEFICVNLRSSAVVLYFLRVNSRAFAVTFCVPCDLLRLFRLLKKLPADQHPANLRGTGADLLKLGVP